MFTIKPTVEQTDPPLSPRETLSTMYNFPCENRKESGFSAQFHFLPSHLLIRFFSVPNITRQIFFLWVILIFNVRFAKAITIKKLKCQ